MTRGGAEGVPDLLADSHVEPADFKDEVRIHKKYPLEKQLEQKKHRNTDLVDAFLLDGKDILGFEVVDAVEDILLDIWQLVIGVFSFFVERDLAQVSCANGADYRQLIVDLDDSW